MRPWIPMLIFPLKFAISDASWVVFRKFETSLTWDMFGSWLHLRVCEALVSKTPRYCIDNMLFSCSIIWNNFHCLPAPSPLVNLHQGCPIFSPVSYLLHYTKTFLWPWPSWEIAKSLRGRRGVKGKPGVAGHLAVKFWALKKPAPLRPNWAGLGWGGMGVSLRI